MRILYFVDTLGLGGIQTILQNYFERIDRDKFEIEVLSLDIPDETGFELWLNEKSIPVHKIPGITLKKIRDFSRYPALIKQFFHEHGDFDILHMHASSKNAQLMFNAAKQNIPIRIIHSHNTHYHTSSQIQKVIGDILKFPMKKYATDLWACSTIAGEWLFGDDNFTIIPNAIDAGKFEYDEQLRNSVRESLNISDIDFVIGNIGRFVNQKNHFRMISVFNDLLKYIPNAKLVLAGTGDLEYKIKQQVIELGIERNVNFLGYRTDNHALYQAFDVYCMPSFYEGLPVALVEAQASGLPIVFSNTITEEINISKKQNIQLSLEKDNKEWVEALIEISNRQINRKINGELIQKSIFNIENAIGLLENKYQELIVRESFR
ncbi:MAG: glycosyltransferase family 1 protein [Lactococcus lactis]|nr:glycosyltransferase family 1 protein [Lactococcus lactis]